MNELSFEHVSAGAKNHCEWLRIAFVGRFYFGGLLDIKSDGF